MSLRILGASPVAQLVKNMPANAGDIRDMGSILENSLEKGKATRSSILAWRMPWTEEPDRLEATESQRFRHD